MAHGERHEEVHKRFACLKPFTSIWTAHNFPSRNGNSAHSDISEAACSDSGSERDENSRNVVRWLESLPIDQQWCEAEEQIGRMEDTTSLLDRFGGIGDTDLPATRIKFGTSNNRLGPSRTPNKKSSKVKKLRRGTHGGSSSNERSKQTKRTDTSRKTLPPKISRANTAIFVPDEPEKKCPAVRPIFRKPEVGKELDDSMARAIKRYRSSVVNWNCPIEKETRLVNYEPPIKRTKPYAYSAWNDGNT